MWGVTPIAISSRILRRRPADWAPSVFGLSVVAFESCCYGLSAVVPEYQ